MHIYSWHWYHFFTNSAHDFLFLKILWWQYHLNSNYLNHLFLFSHRRFLGILIWIYRLSGSGDRTSGDGRNVYWVGSLFLSSPVIWLLLTTGTAALVNRIYFLAYLYGSPLNAGFRVGWREFAVEISHFLSESWRSWEIRHVRTRVWQVARTTPNTDTEWLLRNRRLLQCLIERLILQ